MKSSMIHRPFGKTRWNASCVGLGTWNLGNPWGDLNDEAPDSISGCEGHIPRNQPYRLNEHPEEDKPIDGTAGWSQKFPFELIVIKIC